MQRKLILAGSALAAALLLSACGGGGGNNNGVFFPPVVVNPTPTPEADGAVDTFIAYVRQLVASPTETGEAVSVTQFDPPPTNERLEPVATP